MLPRVELTVFCHQACLANDVHRELAEIAIAEGADPAGIWSDGAFFAFAAGR